MRKADIETRGHNYLPAVNVKVRGYWENVPIGPGTEFADPAFADYLDTLTDDEWNSLFEFACESGWENLRSDAEEIFGAGVTVDQEGRSGGWAVVRGLPDVETWDAIMVSRWARFARWARANADAIPEVMVSLAYINNWEWHKEQTHADIVRRTSNPVMAVMGH
jgi:hypothetical protein